MSSELIAARRWAKKPENRKYFGGVWVETQGAVLEKYRKYGR